MTISTTIAQTPPIQGNGATTVFNYNFLIPLDPITGLAAATLTIYDSVALTSTVISPSNWTISGVGNPAGGSVTYNPGGVPIPSTQYAVISRNLSLVQETSIINQDGFYPAVLEGALDYATECIQQLQAAINLCIQVPVGSGITPTQYLTTVQQAAAAAAVSATNASGSATAAAASAVAAAAAVAAVATQYTGTSTTSITIGNSTPSMTTQTGLAFSAGQYLMVASTASPSNYMHAQVTSYNSTTGALVLSVSDVGGTGTFAAWSISLSGTQGPAGPAFSINGLAYYNTLSGTNDALPFYSTAQTSNKKMALNDIFKFLWPTWSTKTTPANGDIFGFLDSTNSNNPNTITWANIVSAITTGFSGATPPKGKQPNIALYSAGIANTFQYSTGAADIVLKNAAGAKITVNNLTGTGTVNTTGLNGLDTGTVAASTWYSVFGVSNGSGTNGVVFSLNAYNTGPAAGILATYPYWCFMGFIKTDASGANCIGFDQFDKDWSYRVGSNLSALPTICSGTAGSTTVPTYVSQSITTVTPTNIALIAAIDIVPFNFNSSMVVAPTANYGAISTLTNCPPVGVNAGAAQTSSVVRMRLPVSAASIYYASASANNGVLCAGFQIWGM